MKEYKVKNWNKEKLIAFETNLAELFLNGKINCPLHLSGGNEDNLLSFFDQIKKEDYVISTHRNHYHYLLKGGKPQKLLDEIMGKESGVCKGKGRSMHIYDRRLNFISSAIIGGNCAIACGIALALKKKKSKAHVWCFIGDGGEDSGHFMEAARFGLSRRLPLTFIIEDNDKAVETTKQERWHNYAPFNAPNVLRYHYVRRYPHVGIGKHVTF